MGYNSDLFLAAYREALESATAEADAENYEGLLAFMQGSFSDSMDSATKLMSAGPADEKQPFKEKYDARETLEGLLA